MKREERFYKLAVRVAQELVRRALENRGETQYLPADGSHIPLGFAGVCVTESDSGDYHMVGADGTAFGNYPTFSFIVAQLVDDWIHFRQFGTLPRGEVDKQMREAAKALGVSGAGGARPVKSDSDGRLSNPGGYRPLSGPLPANATIKAAFDADRGETTSTISIDICRCNACGAMWYYSFDEEVVSAVPLSEPDPEGYLLPTVQSISHNGSPEVHKEDCPLMAK